MNIISKLGRWIGRLFRTTPSSDERDRSSSVIQAPIVYPSINFVDKAPKNDAVEAGQFYCVVSGDKPKWSLFRCPCGCESVVTLSLQRAHMPHWQVKRSRAGRPGLYPSVWRDSGCLSHFWLNDGRVNWCHDTGTHPDLRAHH